MAKVRCRGCRYYRKIGTQVGKPHRPSGAQEIGECVDAVNRSIAVVPSCVHIRPFDVGVVFADDERLCPAFEPKTEDATNER